jgi:sugar transferase (PEP-CTERM/EpsH1 system associated)
LATTVTDVQSEIPNELQYEPVRVAHLLWRLGVGGMEVGVVKLVNHLDRRRISSRICSFNPADSLKYNLASDVPLYEFRRRKGNDPRLVWQLYRRFLHDRPHIVHTHRWGTLLEGLIAARMARVPVVVHGEHGTMELRTHNRIVQRWVWGRVNRVLSVSSVLAERMAEEMKFPVDRITTIRNGVDLPRFGAGNRAAGRSALGLTSEDLVIGTVGRLVPVKNQAMLLDALAIVRAQGVSFKAVLAGEGPLLADLQARVTSLGLADQVILAGSRQDVPDILAAYDIFVLSSLSEGLSNVILEAMAAGLPVVATNVGGAGELVQQDRTGALVASADPQAMAAALLDLVRSPEARRAMGQAARASAQNFGLDRMIREYEQMYLELAVKNRRADYDVQFSQA